MNKTLESSGKLLLTRLLSKCTVEQDMFKRMYAHRNQGSPISACVSMMDLEKISRALDQVEATLKENQDPLTDPIKEIVQGYSNAGIKQAVVDLMEAEVQEMRMDTGLEGLSERDSIFLSKEWRELMQEKSSRNRMRVASELTLYLSALS